MKPTSVAETAAAVDVLVERAKMWCRTGYSCSLIQCHPFSSSQTGRTTLGSAA
jgi:hypothetical protein